MPLLVSPLEPVLGNSTAGNFTHGSARPLLLAVLFPPCTRNSNTCLYNTLAAVLVCYCRSCCILPLRVVWRSFHDVQSDQVAAVDWIIFATCAMSLLAFHVFHSEMPNNMNDNFKSCALHTTSLTGKGTETWLEEGAKGAKGQGGEGERGRGGARGEGQRAKRRGARRGARGGKRGPEGERGRGVEGREGGSKQVALGGSKRGVARPIISMLLLIGAKRREFSGMIHNH